MTEITGRILVVDDDEANRDLLSRHLRRAGHVVSAAAGGEEALRYLSAHPVDLVMLDVQMPGMSGFDVLRQIRQDAATSRVPVVLVSARALTDDLATGYSLGADDYLTKPVEFSAALERVRIQLQKNRRP